MKSSNTNLRNGSASDAGRNELVSLSLETQIVCPYDSVHVFPLADGLSKASLEGLREKERVNRERIRNELESALRRSSSEKISEMEKALRGKEAAFRSMMEEKSNKLSKIEMENLRLRQNVEEAADRQKVEIAKAVQQQRESDRKELSESVRQSLEAEYEEEREKTRLRMLEIEKQRSDAEKTAEDLRRRIAQGSQQTQGESLEVDLESSLREQFPLDKINEIPKGISGADVVWEIHTREGRLAGKIALEIKHTKSFSKGWLAKAKEDALRVSADIPVIVTTVLPEGVRNFAMIEGVWVTTPACWPALSSALRGQLLAVYRVRVTNEAKDERLEFLYKYLCSPDFKGRVELTVSKVIEMQEQLHQEKRALTKHWSRREKLLQTVSESIACIYGDLQGALSSHELEDLETLSLEKISEED